MEIQITKLRSAIDTFNLRNEELHISISQGSDFKINFGVSNTYPLNSVEAMRTARLCIPFVDDYASFRKMYKENFSVVSTMSTPEVIAMFGALG
jgi:hypothetical protein